MVGPSIAYYLGTLDPTRVIKALLQGPIRVVSKKEDI